MYKALKVSSLYSDNFLLHYMQERVAWARFWYCFLFLENCMLFFTVLALNCSPPPVVFTFLYNLTSDCPLWNTASSTCLLSSVAGYCTVILTSNYLPVLISYIRGMCPNSQLINSISFAFFGSSLKWGMVLVTLWTCSKVLTIKSASLQSQTTAMNHLLLNSQICQYKQSLFLLLPLSSLWIFPPLDVLSFVTFLPSLCVIVITKINYNKNVKL